MSASILQNATNVKFRAKALAEYYHSINEKYTRLLNTLVSFYEFEDDVLDDMYVINDGVFSLTPQAKTKWESLTDVPYEGLASIPDGYISWKSVLSNIILNIVKDEDEEITFEFDVFDADNVKIKTMSFEDIDIQEQFQINLQSSTAFEAAAEACMAVNVADRLTIFRDKLASVFSDAYSDASGALSFYVDALRMDDNTAILDQLVQSLSLDSITKTDSETNTLSKTNIGKYTGASPLAAYDASNVGTAIASTGRIVAKAVKSAINGIFNLGKRLLTKAVSVIKACTSEPQDVKVVNESGDCSYSFDNFFMQVKNATIMIGSEDEQSEDYSMMPKLLGKHANECYKFEFFSGEILFSFKEVVQPSQKPYELRIKGVDICFKPYVLDPDIVATIVNGSGGSLETLENGKRYLAVDGTSLPVIATQLCLTRPYLDAKIDNEAKLYEGLLLSKYFTYLICNLGLSELKYNFAYIRSGSVTYEIPSNITNATWIKCLTGWSGESFTTEDFDSDISSSTLSFMTMIGDIIKILVEVVRDQQVHPFNYIFVPYRKGVTSFNSARFSLRTDDENANAVQKFIDAVIIITIAVVGAVAAGVVVKKLSNSITKKALLRKAKYERMMASGTKLSDRDLKKYERAVRRTKNLTSLTGGLRGFELPTSTVSYASGDNGYTGAKSNFNLGSMQDHVTECTDRIINLIK